MSTKVNRDPSRSLLITPSASPPPRTGTHRTSDAAPPLKRQRVASESRSSSIQLATESKIDIQKEREASRVRLLDVWSNLAERYSRHLDEDDIVDIRTGEIVKDNGFWRGTKKYNFGLTLSSGDTDGNQEDDEAEEVSEDEDVDELDAFAYEDDDQLEEYLSKGLSAKEAALAGNRPTSDADDLQDFLEAEKRRREEYGSDFDEDELEPLRYRCGQEDTLASSENEDEGEPEEGNEEASEEYVPDGEQLETNSPIYESASEEAISEDELGNWEPNEASMVVLTNSHSNKQQEDDTDTSESDVEIVACSFPNKSGSLSLSVKEQKPPTQLQTPPLSQSSADCRSRSSSKSTPSPSSSPPPPSTSPFPSSSPPPVPSPKKVQIRRSYRRHDASEDDIPRPRKRHDVPEDDDDDLPILRPSQLPPIPALNSSLSRARSAIPEVVITTLPPKVANNSTQLKRSQGSHLPTIVKTKTRIIDSKADSSKGPHSRKGNDVSLVSKSKSTTHSRLDDTPKRQASPAKRRGKSPQPQEELVEPHTSKQAGISLELGSSPLSSPRVKSSKQNGHGVENKAGNSHKRKRVSAEHVPAESVSLQYPSRLQKTLKSKSKSKSKSKPAETSSSFERYGAGSSRSRPRHVSPLANEYSSSSDERRPTNQSAYHFPSTPAFSHNPSPYISRPLTHLYPPVADPRAQQIITHAMQQLSSLLWSPSHANTQIPFPFTPQHQRFSSASPNFMNLTPEHPHPYPFTYDPALSRATLPPSSSPEPPSSPTKPGRKSLVSQGQSRGRRVSFSVKKTSRDRSTSSSHSSSSDPEPLNRRNEQQSPHKGKGKAVSATTTLHDEGDSEEEFPRPSILALKRAQTPGPEKTSKSTPRGSSQSAGLGQISSNNIRSPTKSRIQKKKV